MSDEPIRLSKLMAHRGLCSRREADEFISRGLVVVDGVVISELGTKVSPEAKVVLRAGAQREQDSLVTILINKPVGYVSSQPEPRYQPAIALVTPENQFGDSRQRLRREHLRGLAVAGRLDIDSQGLLLMTQDGRLAKKIIGEDRKIEKEYLVRVVGQVTEEKLRLLRYGLSLDGRPLLPAKVDRLNQDQLRVVLKEGRKRQIRRMCDMVGLEAVGLKRVRIGRILLGKLPEGMWRFLEPWETVE